MGGGLGAYKTTNTADAWNRAQMAAHKHSYR